LDNYVGHIDYGEVILNNMPLLVVGPIGFELTNIYGRKIHQGDPGPNDHAVDSTISQESHQGGIGTLVYRGDDDRGNCWFSTAWMQTSRQLSLPPKTFVYDAGVASDFGYIHDKLNGVIYASTGSELLKWTGSTFAPITPSPVALSSTPVDSGVTWGDETTPAKLFIPYATGYDTWDGATHAAGVMVTGKGPISLVIWEEKLFGLAEDGSIYFTTDGVSGTWTFKGKIPNSLTPRKLFIWLDRDNQPAVHIATSGSVFALDFVNSLTIETDLKFPDHPTQGLGAEMWRADAYVSVGLGVHRQSNGLIQAVGPDGRDGLPDEFSSGYIRSIAGGYNEYYVSIVGERLGEVEPEELHDLNIGLPELMTTWDPGRYGMVMGYNGFGFHPRWVGQEEPTTIRVLSYSGYYWLMWGTRGHLMWQQLPIGYYNPTFSTANIPLERTAYHITPYYNWGLTDSPKIMKYFEFKATNMCEVGDPCTGDQNYIEVFYRIDDDEAWTPLRSAQQGDEIRFNGQHRLLIGFDSIDGRQYHSGMAHERIQFMFILQGKTTDDLATPVIEWYTLVGRKWMKAVKVFQMQIDGTNTHKQQDSKAIREHIEATARKKGGVPLVIGDMEYIVDVTTDSGNIEPSLSWSGYHNVTCIQFVEEDNE
jgi:hypothetical protein